VLAASRLPPSTSITVCRGRKGRRPALDALLTSARRREVDVVACTKLDRLARSVRHLCNLSSELEAWGVDLVVVDQGIDTSSPTGRLLFHTLAAVAEFERDLVSERTRAGVEAARRRGAVFGRPRVLDAAAKRRVGRLRRSGHSIREIASLLGVSASTVARQVKSLGDQ
jgi:DNA invertase Pin-like site-specific DNA recombinase